MSIDVATEVAGVLHAAYGDRLPLPTWQNGFHAAGYLGKKNGRGIYQYEGRKRGPVNREVYAILELTPPSTSPTPATSRSAWSCG